MFFQAEPIAAAAAAAEACGHCEGPNKSPVAPCGSYEVRQNFGQKLWRAAKTFRGLTGPFHTRTTPSRAVFFP